MSGSGGGGTRTCTHRNLFASFVGPVGLLYDLGRLVELPLLPVGEGEVGEISLTLDGGLEMRVESRSGENVLRGKTSVQLMTD